MDGLIYVCRLKSTELRIRIRSVRFFGTYVGPHDNITGVEWESPRGHVYVRWVLRQKGI